MLTFRLLVVLGVSSLLGLTEAQVAPECGITCASQVMQQPQFSNQTQAELCVNVPYYELVGGCVKEECSVVDSLLFLNFTRTACGLPAEDHRHEVQVVTLTMFAVASFFFCIRMVVKFLRYTPWGADDTWLVAAFALMTPFIVLIQLMIPEGLGLEIWVLTEDQITSFLRFLLATQESYILSIAIVKASILAFFLRIFPDERFKIVVWCTLAFDLFVGFIFFVLSLVQRQPTWLIWEGWKYKDPRGVRLDLNNTGLAHGGMNVALDVWMLVLPFTQLYKLNHPLHKKLGIFSMFSVGIFLTVVAAIRVHNLSTFATSQNITNDVLEGVIWSCIELCVGVLVACMPHTRQLFRETTRKFRHPARPAVSIERTGRWNWRQQGARRDSLESGTAVGSPGAGAAPVDKSWYSSTTQSAYTTTTCTSDRQPSSFASEATTRIGSVAQHLDETAASKMKITEEKPESQG